MFQGKISLIFPGKMYQKHLWWCVMLSKTTDDWLATLLKKDYFHRCFLSTFLWTTSNWFSDQWIAGSIRVQLCDSSKKLTIVTWKNRLENSLHEILMESKLKTRQNKINILAENHLPLKKKNNNNNNTKKNRSLLQLVTCTKKIVSGLGC